MSSHVGLVMVWKNIHFAHQNSISFCASTINHASWCRCRLSVGCGVSGLSIRETGSLVVCHCFREREVELGNVLCPSMLHEVPRRIIKRINETQVPSVLRRVRVGRRVVSDSVR